MADAYLEIEEYLWFDEYQQGNVNVAGLVFDDLVEDAIGIDHEVYTVWVEQVIDTIDFLEGDFTGRHWQNIYETLTIRETYGHPLRVRQTALNVAMTPSLTPAMIAHVHLDILHGCDIYWEEVSSEIQAHSSYANAVPYYWEYIYESLDIDMTEPQPEPPVILQLQPVVSDLVNMRHDVEQEYLFNSKCFDELFIWPEMVWGWDHLVESVMDQADSIQEIIGKIADDSIYMGSHSVPLVKVRHLLDDRFFVFDALDVERFYLCQANETIVITDGDVSLVDVITVGTLEEDLEMSVVVSPQTDFMGLALESLTFADISTFVHEIIIEEGFNLGDVDLARWVFSVMVESGCDIADIIS